VTRLFVITFLLACYGIGASAADPFVGTWKLNKEKTTSDRAALKEFLQTMESGGPNELIVRVKSTDAGGKITTFQNILHFDGKGYAAISSATGKVLPKYTTVSTRIDDRHYRNVSYKNSKQFQMTESAISADGRTRTNTIKGLGLNGAPINEVDVYDKQ
jgi:hypothetical protein